MCQKHFKDECFENKWTKPRDKSKQGQLVMKLKKDAVPSKLLVCKRKVRDKETYRRKPKPKRIKHEYAIHSRRH